LGTAVGAVLGVLYAPMSGDEMRQTINDTAGAYFKHSEKEN